MLCIDRAAIDTRKFRTVFQWLSDLAPVITEVGLQTKHLYVRDQAPTEWEEEEFEEVWFA